MNIATTDEGEDIKINESFYSTTRIELIINDMSFKLRAFEARRLAYALLFSVEDLR